MLATHETFTRQMCDRLKTTCMGLGLVRLLQDARRFDEAKTTLYLLENGVQTEDDFLNPFHLFTFGAHRASL